MNAAAHVCIHTMYHDISNTVIMLRHFDQWVLAHKTKVPREDLGNTMNPALSQEFHLFCEQEHLQRHANTDKNPYCVYGTLKPPYVIGTVPKLSGHANAYRWRSLPRIRRHRAISPQDSSSNGCCLCITTDQLMCASLYTAHTYMYFACLV